MPVSETETPKLKVPLAVAVPEIVPVELRARPLGRLPEIFDQL